MGILKQILVWAAVVEVPTAVARFGLGMESTRDTASTIGKLTFGLRIHHGYFGILLLVLALLMGKESKFREGTLILGGALALSDFFHHFVLLWGITGSPQFDVWYPR